MRRHKCYSFSELALNAVQVRVVRLVLLWKDVGGVLKLASVLLLKICVLTKRNQLKLQSAPKSLMFVLAHLLVIVLLASSCHIVGGSP